MPSSSRHRDRRHRRSRGVQDGRTDCDSGDCGDDCVAKVFDQDCCRFDDDCFIQAAFFPIIWGCFRLNFYKVNKCSACSCALIFTTCASEDWCKSNSSPKAVQLLDCCDNNYGSDDGSPLEFVVPEPCPTGSSGGAGGSSSGSAEADEDSSKLQVPAAYQVGTYIQSSPTPDLALILTSDKRNVLVREHATGALFVHPYRVAAKKSCPGVKDAPGQLDLEKYAPVPAILCRAACKNGEMTDDASASGSESASGSGGAAHDKNIHVHVLGDSYILGALSGFPLPKSTSGSSAGAIDCTKTQVTATCAAAPGLSICNDNNTGCKRVLYLEAPVLD